MMNVDVEAIKLLLELVREHELAEFELEQEGIKIRVRKQGAVHTLSAPAVMMPAPPALALAPAAPAGNLPGPALAAAGGAAVGGVVEDPEAMELAVVTSPIVGTFYRAPDPSSPPFVEIGQKVQRGKTLCIIEAMKLMNEIESEYEGEVVKCYVENGQPVQYGERLFAIKT
jgi:acetyl-CoA carboxylase biotin carboxyl carrier protein